MPAIKELKVPDLPAALKRGLESKKDEHPWDDMVLHVSDLSVSLGPDGTCPRALWLRLKGAEKKPPTPGELLMFDHGAEIHKRLDEILRDGLGHPWEIVAREKKVTLDGDITGRLDCLVRNITTGADVVVDFKTQRGRAFGFMNGPRPSHVLQVQAYMAAEGIDRGLIFYVDREGQNAAAQYVVERDDFKVYAAIDYARAIRDQIEPPGIFSAYLNIKENKGPDSVKLEIPWQCSYCNYRGVSCPGPLPQDIKDLKDLGIIGYIKDGKFSPFKETKQGKERLCSKKVEAVAHDLYRKGAVGSRWMVEDEKGEVPF